MKRVHFPDMPPWHAPVPATYCGATADGFVVLTDACGSFAAGSEIPHAIAMQNAAVFRGNCAEGGHGMSGARTASEVRHADA